MVSSVDVVMDQVVQGSSGGRLQERTRMAMRTILVCLSRGQTMDEAAAVAAVNPRTIKDWRKVYPAFGSEVLALVSANQAERSRGRATERRERLEEKGLVLRHDEPLVDRGSLTDFRWRYFGRPTPPHQETAVMALEDPSNLYVFVFGPTGPQPFGSAVLTPGGWSKIEDIAVNDVVTGRDGKPKRVTAVTDVGLQPVFRVTFDDGSVVRAAENHTWTVKARSRRGRGWHEAQTWQLAGNVTNGRGWNFQVPVVAPVEQPDQELAIDPYLVGVLLGDGCLRQNSPKFSTADPELVEAVRGVLPFDCRLHQVNDVAWHIYSDERTRPTRLRAALVEAGMWGCYAYEKSIPAEYLAGSVTQRLGLLQGLMDSDGSADERGRCLFTSTSYQLAVGVCDLVRSLGGWASQPSPSEREGRRLCWSVSVALADLSLFRLTRKQSRVSRRAREITRKVVAVEPDGVEACLCLTVADEHYVTDGYVVTHNCGKDTLAGDYVAWESAPDRSGLRVAWFMETGPFSKRRLNRLARYLTDPAAYRSAPEKTPGGQVPTSSLITDFGPFEWKPGMVWEDGTDVDRPEWTQTAKYFVRSVAPEQDPNLWATGVEGAAYGSRIGICVCSDMFTVENQKSPTERHDQYTWVGGTLDTRLDEDGRLVTIGTMLPIENNYERLLEDYVGESRVLRQVTIGPGVYTKYSNGVAVVVIKAIWVNPETGEEESYWGDRFPLNDHLYDRMTDERIDLTTISDAEALELMDAGWKRLRGLRSRRERNPVMFKAMFQQERDPDVGLIDFTDEVFEAAYDRERSFGYVLPHEIKLLGVDPAQRYGAAWALLAVDRETSELCVADFWWGEKLGFTGIKDKLILQPMGRYLPSWLCYEPNREGAVLADPVIQRIIGAQGVSIFTPPVGRERGDPIIGPGALATWMGMGKLRIPYATAEDRMRAEELKSQLRAFDADPKRSKPGRAGHHPDDLTFAVYAAWRKGVQLVDRDMRDTGIVAGVPAAIRRAMDRRREEYQSKKGKDGREPRDVLTRGNPLEMLAAIGGESDD